MSEAPRRPAGSKSRPKGSEARAKVLPGYQNVWREGRVVALREFRARAEVFSPGSPPMPRRSLADTLAAYYDLCHDITLIAARLGGYPFGGAPRDCLAGQIPADIDLVFATPACEQLEGGLSSERPSDAAANLILGALCNDVLAGARGVRAAEIDCPAAAPYGCGHLTLLHEHIPGRIKVDVVLDPEPKLDFDVNGLAFAVDPETGQLGTTPNPRLADLQVDLKAASAACAKRTFSIVRPSLLGKGKEGKVLAWRLRKMMKRGWTCLNLPSAPAQT